MGWLERRWMLVATVALAIGVGCDPGVVTDGTPRPDGEVPQRDGGEHAVPDGGAHGSRDGASPDGGARPIDGGRVVDGGESLDGGHPALDGGDPPGLTFGYPVYTQAEIDAWSTSSPEYTALARSWAGNVDRAYTSYGTEISSVERDLLKDESGYMKVQAVLWAADGNTARRDKVITMLNELRSVTSWEWDPVEQYRLVAGWACTNLAQAAAIIGYHDPGLRRFLVEQCYPILDWTTGGNWHASFADSRLAIAAYVGDADLWADAKAYFYRRIGQSNYHSSYDGMAVLPIRNEAGTPQVAATQRHWGGNWGAAQINMDFTPIDPAQFPDGTNAERTRDLGHVSMGLGGWMHGARTILAQGDVLEPHAYDRLRAAYVHHGDRVLAYLTTGVIPAPTPARGDGGGSLRQAWFGARALFGADTPPVVRTLCERSEVTSFPPAGANHLVAEPFADGT